MVVGGGLYVRSSGPSRSGGGEIGDVDEVPGSGRSRRRGDSVLRPERGWVRVSESGRQE